MGLESVKIFLCIIISLLVCQYTRSQYVPYKHVPVAKPQNFTYYLNDPDNSYILDMDSKTYDENVTRIAGGEYAKLGSFPYMAVVHQLLGNGMIGQCGGTIISKRWVLTAAHCAIKDPQKFLVVFGIIDKSGIGYDFLRGRGLSMIATQAFVHPQYREGYNDIAVLYMPHDIPFSNTVQPVKLAYQGKSFANKNAHVVGWGKDHMDSTGTSRLKYATLPIIENNECKQYWYITNGHICTAPELGRDACQGDSGGPLIVVENGQDVQVGIVSYGDAFCPSNSPGVFTRISSFMNWINKITQLY